MTGPEFKQLRKDLGEAIGRELSAADMAKLCGLSPASGPDTIRRWEVSGPTGPVAERLRILAMASERYPILEKFNVFDGNVLLKLVVPESLWLFTRIDNTVENVTRLVLFVNIS